MKKILILGGNRFVGYDLSKTLLSCGFEVDVFNRRGTSADDDIKIIRGDRNNKEDLNKINFNQYHAIVDMCLYLPSQFDLIRDLISFETNYIFVSSGAADTRYVSFFENNYGVDKLEIEEMLKSTDINFDIIRPSYIVGKHNHHPRLGYFIDRLANDEVIHVAGDGNNSINVVFVEDVVEVLTRLVLRNSPKMKTYNVCSDKSWTVMDLIFIIKEKFFQDVDEVKVVHQSNLAPFYDFVFELDNTDVCNDLKIDFTDIDDGLNNLVEWHLG